MTKLAWIENGVIRDIAPGDPHQYYVASIASLYNTIVPDLANNGDSYIEGVLTPRVEPEPGPPIELPPPAPVPPQKVTRRQALQALRINNVMPEQIVAGINLLPIPQLNKDLAVIEFNESLDFEYNRPLVLQLCALMGLDRDALFILAGTL